MLDADDRRWRDPPPPRPALRPQRLLLGESVLVDTGLPFRSTMGAFGGCSRGAGSIGSCSRTRTSTMPARSRTRRPITALRCSARTRRSRGDLAAGSRRRSGFGQPLNPIQRAIVRYRPLRAVPLRDGQEVGAGFVAVETRGHTPGHHSLWRERDRVLIAGDALFGVSSRFPHWRLPRRRNGSARAGELSSCDPAARGAATRDHRLRSWSAARDGCRPPLSALAAALR